MPGLGPGIHEFIARKIVGDVQTSAFSGLRATIVRS